MFFFKYITKQYVHIMLSDYCDNYNMLICTKISKSR